MAKDAFEPQKLTLPLNFGALCVNKMVSTLAWSSYAVISVFKACGKGSFSFPKSAESLKINVFVFVEDEHALDAVEVCPTLACKGHSRHRAATFWQ